MLNVISIDVEEYFHAANLEPVIGTAKWRSSPSRIEYSTEKILALLERCEVRGTFFILGWSARRFPNLVKKIAAAGHEIASHGYRHRLVYRQTANQFYRDIDISKKLIEDISGKKVIGYRAPNFSITDATW